MIHKCRSYGLIEFSKNEIEISKNDLPSRMLFYNDIIDYSKRSKYVWKTIHTNDHRDNDLPSYYSIDINIIYDGSFFCEICSTEYYKYNFMYKYTGYGLVKKDPNDKMKKYFNFIKGICIKLLKMNVE